MIDIELIRANPELMRANLEKRGDAEKLSLLDELIEKDRLWRKLKAEADSLRNCRNILSQQINSAKKAGQDVSLFLKEAQEIPEKIDSLEKDAADLRQRCSWILMRLPNILHGSVPVGKDDSENVVVKASVKPKKPKFEIR
ncbi:MAG: serine--tRNA ligase, partial [Candidatus ainarchaeum sp.]|nr:serine--tRNA ligase [Candidatus ainarchaeum sp.]